MWQTPVTGGHVLSPTSQLFGSTPATNLTVPLTLHLLYKTRMPQKSCDFVTSQHIK
ncbi:MAG TPA: hypothetical protein PL128_03160 [Ginsengibacter sp.]|nr:hypothetical protein [Ginsengibacter sp.]